MKNTDPQKNTKCRAFTQVEMLLAIGIIAILATVGSMGVSSLKGATSKHKLKQDVASLNEAVSVYLSNGGNLEGTSTADEVMTRLKTRASDDQSEVLVGLRSSVLDPRVVAVEQSEKEAQSHSLRAFWDPTAERFVLATTGARGIKKMALDESMAGDLEAVADRETAVQYASKDESSWVWKYADVGRTGGRDSSFAERGFSGSAPPAMNPTPSPSPSQLSPPVVSIPGGDYSLFGFENLMVSIDNPNPNGSSEIIYSVEDGQWDYYTTRIAIVPGTVVLTQAVRSTTDWIDSSVVREEYTTDPVKLVAGIAFATSDFNYVALGGALEPGNYAAPTLAAPGIVNLVNWGEIPNGFQNSSVFNVQWTMDGSDPSSSSDASLGGSFTDGFSEQEIPVGLEDFGTEDSLMVRGMFKSFDETLVLDSASVIATLQASQLQLGAPLLSFGSTNEVLLALDVDRGDVPLGARIFYTIDGTDPGVGGDGEPVTGELYSGEFVAPEDATDIVARVYPPENFRQWFTASELTQEEIPAGSSVFDACALTVVMGRMNLNGTVVGNIWNTAPSSFSINSSAKIEGDLLLAGTPNVRLNGSPTFSGVVEGDGDASPSGYYVTINSGAELGYLRTRQGTYEFPTVTPEPNPSGSYYNIDNASSVPSNWFPNAGVNINSNAGAIYLPPGDYGRVNASNNNSGGKIVLGNSDGTPAEYSFTEMTLNSGVPVEILGPVTIKAGNFMVNSGSVIGSEDTREWLNIQVWGDRLTDNSQGTIWANQILVPNGSVMVNGSVHASVITKDLTVNSSGKLYTGDDQDCLDGVSADAR